MGAFFADGGECSVYLHYKHRVKKTYPNPEYAAHAYELALMAEEAGLGPTVYSLNGCSYITEKVQTFNYQDKPEDHFTYDEIEEFLGWVEESLGEGFVWDVRTGDGSLYYANVGMKNGELILIDFGPESSGRFS